MKRRVFRVAAVIEELFRSAVLSPDAGELLSSRMSLAKMDAQSALPIVKLLHVSPP